MAVEAGAVMEEQKGVNSLDDDRHELFCQEYLKDLNVAQSAIRAGFSIASARQYGHRVFNRPEVQERIAYLKQERMDALGLDTYYVLKSLKTVAERCMQGEQVTDREGAPVFIQGPDEQYATLYKFEHAGANKALELIGKHVGMFGDKLEITGANGKDLVPPTFNIIGVKPNGDRE